jgi:hypothetical protein
MDEISYGISKEIVLKNLKMHLSAVKFSIGDTEKCPYSMAATKVEHVLQRGTILNDKIIHDAIQKRSLRKLNLNTAHLLH